MTVFFSKTGGLLAELAEVNTLFPQTLIEKSLISTEIEFFKIKGCNAGESFEIQRTKDEAGCSQKFDYKHTYYLISIQFYYIHY